MVIPCRELLTMSIVRVIDRVIHKQEWMHDEHQVIQRSINNFLKLLKSNKEKKINFEIRIIYFDLLQIDLSKVNIEEQYIIDLDSIKHLLDRYHHRFVLLH